MFTVVNKHNELLWKGLVAAVGYVNCAFNGNRPIRSHLLVDDKRGCVPFLRVKNLCIIHFVVALGVE